MILGQVGPEEASRLAALHARTFERPWSPEDLAGMLRGEDALAFAAEDGFILLRMLGPEAEILTLAVDPDARRRGLGRLLLGAAIGAAAARGAGSVFLEVAADNAPALALYAEAGFARVGLRRGYYPRSAEPAVDALTLRLSLPSPAP